MLHSLEQAVEGIGLHVNAHKAEYMFFNQRGHISTLNDSSLKLVDKITYQGNRVLSTKTDINTLLAKARTDIDRLSVIWRSNLTDKMKRFFFRTAVVSILPYESTTWTLTYGEKAWRQLHKNAASNIEWVLKAIPHKAASIQPLTTHHEKYQS